MKKYVISAFVIVHLAAVGLTNLPACSLKSAMAPAWVEAYLSPTGQWQAWGMFGPDPAHSTASLEAVVRDSQGLVRHYAFPRMMDQSAWTGFVGGYRHSKYNNNMGLPAYAANREFAARYVTRALKLRESDFPADVQLVYQVWPTKPVDAPADAPPASPSTSVIETYHFPTLAETLP